MIQPKFILFGSLVMLCSYEAVHAMKCQLPMGLELSCPTMFNDNDKAFCCNTPENVPYCCDIGDYIRNNSAIIAGILVGAIIILIIVTLCCCCFCSCCLLAKRRVQRGTVLYVPVAPQQMPVVSPGTVPPPLYSSSPYPMQPGLVVHTPPPDSACPPPYYQAGKQPALNPDYKA